MCQHKTISSNSFGCLIQCKNCEQFHLGFGSIVLALSHDEFVQFSNQVHQIHLAHYNETKENNDKIYMHTDSSKIILAFNHREWLKLYSLLEESRFLLHAHELIER